MDELKELADYFGFSLKQNDPSVYTGTVVFNVSVPQLNNQKVQFTVRITKGSPSAEVWISLPPDKKHDVWVDISLPDLLHVYSGAAGAADVASLVLSGRIRVGWFKFAELKNFANSFDYRSETWIDFYRTRSRRGDDKDGIKKADAMLRQLWQKVLAAGNPPSSLVDESGRVIPPEEVKTLPAHRVVFLTAIGRHMVDEGKPFDEALQVATVAAEAAKLVAGEAAIAGEEALALGPEAALPAPPLPPPKPRDPLFFPRRIRIEALPVPLPASTHAADSVGVAAAGAISILVEDVASYLRAKKSAVAGTLGASSASPADNAPPRWWPGEDAVDPEGDMLSLLYAETNNDGDDEPAGEESDVSRGFESQRPADVAGNEAPAAPAPPTSVTASSVSAIASAVRLVVGGGAAIEKPPATPESATPAPPSTTARVLALESGVGSKLKGAFVMLLLSRLIRGMLAGKQRSESSENAPAGDNAPCSEAGVEEQKEEEDSNSSSEVEEAHWLARRINASESLLSAVCSTSDDEHPLDSLCGARLATLRGRGLYFRAVHGDGSVALLADSSVARIHAALRASFAVMHSGGPASRYCSGLAMAPGAAVPQSCASALQTLSECANTEDAPPISGNLRLPASFPQVRTAFLDCPSFPPTKEQRVANEAAMAILGFERGRAFTSAASEHAPAAPVRMSDPSSSSRFSLALVHSMPAPASAEVSAGSVASDGGRYASQVRLLPFDRDGKTVYTGLGSDVWLRASKARLRMQLEETLFHTPVPVAQQQQPQKR